MTSLAPTFCAEHATTQAAKAVKVVQVTYSLVAGGSERFASILATQLNPERFQTVICALDQGGALEPELQEQGVTYHVLHRPARVDWRTAWRLYEYFRDYGANVVQTHHFAQLLHAVFGAKLMGARLIHVEHSVKHYAKWRYRFMLRWLAKCCHRVVAIGQDVAQVLEHQVGIPAHKLTIIRAGLDVARYREDRRTSREALGLDQTAPIAVIIARLAPEKRHCHLLEAFARVCQVMPHARLLIVGDGPEEGSIRAKVNELQLQDNVQLMGVRRDVARLLAASDVFVLASEREGLPLAALEAMAAARPVVATAVGDLPTVVNDGVRGRIVPKDDVPALANALVDLLRHPKNAAAMGARGRAYVTEEFGLQTMLTKHEELYLA